MNKPNIHNNIIGDISSFQNEFNDLFSSTGLYFKSKVIESSRKGGNNVFKYLSTFFNMHIAEVVIFLCCLVVISSQLFF